MTTLYGGAGSDTPGSGSQVWYDPQELLQQAPGVDDDVKTFWLDAVGYQLGRQLYEPAAIAELSQPVYSDMTLENFQTLGAPVIFNQWMFEYFWQQIKSGNY